MKGMNFKKASLLSGILLLSVFVVFQLSWACDDDDKWDHDCHNKWHCVHQSKPCHPPKIQIVYLTHPEGSIEFEILGKNFDNGIRPVVTLGGLYKLNVKDGYSDTRIIATLPLEDLKEEFEYGDYRLVVSTCHDSSCEYKYCKDYCFNCKGKHCKDYCSRCKDRYCKDKYCRDHEYECRCKDRYSLTIAAPSGAAGKFDTVIVTEQEFKCDEPTGSCFGVASCAKAGEGFKVTGGGFDSVNLIITVSKPSGDGWRVEGSAFDIKADVAPSLTVWAVCGKVQTGP